MRIRDWSSDVCSSDLEAVLLMGKASPDWVVVRLALGAMGALTVACDHLATKDEVARLVRHSGCHRAFVAAEHVAMLRELDGGGRVTLHLLDEAAPGSGLASWRSLMSEAAGNLRSEENTSELQSLMRNPYAGFCLQKHI